MELQQLVDGLIGMGTGVAVVSLRFWVEFVVEFGHEEARTFPEARVCFWFGLIGLALGLYGFYWIATRG